MPLQSLHEMREGEYKLPVLSLFYQLLISLLDVPFTASAIDA
jgi:hypothetical protein